MLGGACHPPSGTAPIWPPIFTALLISLVCLTVQTPAPDLGVDASWLPVLQWAHEHGLQFGTDVVFTYGPLGYLLAPYCFKPPSNWLILVNAALCFQIALGLASVRVEVGAGMEAWAVALFCAHVRERGAQG